jgi:hypothetical protein
MTTEQPCIHVQPAPRVRIPLASAITGLTQKAIRCKIDRGSWLEGREYHRDPEGNVWVDIAGVMRWVGGGR